MGALPLSGLRVVAVEQAVSAPFCTRQLVDLGAEVIKIERPGEGDFARGYDKAIKGESAYFAWLNRGKKSVALDIRAEPGRTQLARPAGGRRCCGQSAVGKGDGALCRGARRGAGRGRRAARARANP